MPVFESIFSIHRIHRFKMTLPETVVKLFKKLILDKSYLQSQRPDILAFLLFANASPSLLSLSIKVL